MTLPKSALGNAVALFRAELAKYGKTFPSEWERCRRFDDFVNRFGLAAWSRDTSEGHLTASAWILDAHHRRAVLLFHPKLERWLQPGGHVELGEALIDAAAREGREETGLPIEPLTDTFFDLDIHMVPARGPMPQHLHYDVRFVFQTNHEQFAPAAGESASLRWVPIAEIVAFGVDRSVEQMARKTIENQKLVGLGSNQRPGE